MESHLNISEDVPHCHTSHDSSESISRRQAVKQLVTASILCVIFIIAEVIGGIIANSLAIATDAAHLLTDLASFAIGLFALYLASRPPTKRMSFGWYRAEVLGAMISVLTIWLVTVVLVYLAVMRLISDDYEINALVMMITAALGAVFNVCMILTLGHGHSHKDHSHQSDHQSTESHLLGSVTSGETNERTMLVADKKSQSDINVRAAFIHVIGDLVQSVGVLVAAIIIYAKPEWKMADPICTFIFSILVLFTTGRILKDIFQVLMEGVPTNVSFNDVKAALNSLDGVKEVHNLRIWSLTTTKVAISVHLALESIEKSDEILRTAGQMLKSNFNIYENTIQTESYVNGMDDCTKCKDPKD